MITIEPFFPSYGGHAADPVLAGVTRGLAQAFGPAELDDLPDHLAELIQRLQDGDASPEG